MLNIITGVLIIIGVIIATIIVIEEIPLEYFYLRSNYGKDEQGEGETR